MGCWDNFLIDLIHQYLVKDVDPYNSKEANVGGEKPLQGVTNYVVT